MLLLALSSFLTLPANAAGCDEVFTGWGGLGWRARAPTRMVRVHGVEEPSTTERHVMIPIEEVTVELSQDDEKVIPGSKAALTTYFFYKNELAGFTFYYEKRSHAIKLFKALYDACGAPERLHGDEVPHFYWTGNEVSVVMMFDTVGSPDGFVMVQYLPVVETLREESAARNEKAWSRLR